MKKVLEQFIIFLHLKYGVTPNMLTYMRMFAAPWLALFVSHAIESKSISFSIFTIVLYFVIISTDFFDGLLARHISKSSTHDHFHGGMIDRLSDKILIMSMLIPFGLNFLTFSIILGESILAYQAINAKDEKKQATYAGKLKMLFQTFLIPVLLVDRVTNVVSDMILFSFIIITIILTYISIYSHYHKKD